MLLATFASLRWGEATALRRCDLDLNARTVRVRAAYIERSTGEMLIGPPKSRAGRRIVGIPEVIVPALREHLAVFAEDDPGALAFPGAKGGPLRRGNFNKMSAWPHAVASIGMPGLHFHDLRHTGNQFAAYSGARLRDLMARMGHDSERAAMIRQNTRSGALTRRSQARSTRTSRPSRRDAATMRMVRPACWSLLANGPLMARTVLDDPRQARPRLRNNHLTCGYTVERVTGIEPALSAWEADVLPLNYTRAYLHCFATEPACAVFAQTSYRTR